MVSELPAKVWSAKYSQSYKYYGTCRSLPPSFTEERHNVLRTENAKDTKYEVRDDLVCIEGCAKVRSYHSSQV